MTRCDELVAGFGGHLVPCDREGTEVRLRCPAGRPDAVACYCDEHGGWSRARDVAGRDWNYLAPECVGGAQAVEAAGCAQLQTVHAYVVVRQEPAENGGAWLAWLGLGSLMQAVPNPAPPAPRINPRTGLPRSPRGGRGRPRRAEVAAAPRYSFATRDEALQAARAAWELELQRRVCEVTKLRGGVLSWGSPVEPLDEPVVIVLEQGDARSAWDVAVALPRRGREGVAAISGLRPSGECA